MPLNQALPRILLTLSCFLFFHATPTFAAETRSAECVKFIQSLPSHFIRDWVRVPEDWSKPNGSQIEVFYYARPAKGETDAHHSIPIVHFNGGPGQDSHGSYFLLEKIPLLQNTPMVFIDQRGTGCSTAYPTAIDRKEYTRISNYGSRAIVLDAEAIRVRLYGISQKWKIYGQSFGGSVVYRYIQIAPQGIYRAYAHGFGNMASPTEWLKLRLFSQKEVAAQYFLIYPGDQPILKSARAQIASTQCYSASNAEVCGNGILDSLIYLLGVPLNWNALHTVIGNLLDENGKLKRETIQLIMDRIISPNFGPSTLPSGLIAKMDFQFGLSDKNLCTRIIPELTREGQIPESWDFNECRFVTATHSPEDDIVNEFKDKDPVLLSDVAKNLIQFPALKFYLYSGAKDSFSPPSQFREAIQILGPLGLVYRQFPDSGHEGFFTESEVLTDLIRL